MARVKRRVKSASSRDPAALSEEYERLKGELRALGYIALGSIAARRFTCGKPSCACAQDPKQRHGPYYHWTRKVRNKTRSRILPSSILPLVRQAIRNRRQMNRIIDKMLNLSVSAFEAARIDSNP
jgi:hypothetical protein